MNAVATVYRTNLQHRVVTQTLQQSPQALVPLTFVDELYQPVLAMDGMMD